MEPRRLVILSVILSAWSSMAPAQPSQLQPLNTRTYEPSLVYPSNKSDQSPVKIEAAFYFSGVIALSDGKIPTIQLKSKIRVNCVSVLIESDDGFSALRDGNYTPSQDRAASSVPNSTSAAIVSAVSLTALSAESLTAEPTTERQRGRIGSDIVNFSGAFRSDSVCPPSRGTSRFQN